MLDLGTLKGAAPPAMGPGVRQLMTAIQQLAAQGMGREEILKIIMDLADRMKLQVDSQQIEQLIDQVVQ